MTILIEDIKTVVADALVFSFSPLNPVLDQLININQGQDNRRKAGIDGNIRDQCPQVGEKYIYRLLL